MVVPDGFLDDHLDILQLPQVGQSRDLIETDTGYELVLGTSVGVSSLLPLTALLPLPSSLRRRRVFSRFRKMRRRGWWT